ncbi:MAG: EFR1 family ferrodoxin [Phascolarctobacterium sp.]|uniref:EFR1 family ferrodoxin n=1 Tax=Phascolarctobacterium sp. TaxID=2049039 RepID=UPI0026DB6DC6|nr:EFR1 family ferrodoxin [Phascolarctobacterium sp.]MDO4920382.1 EFR1 family ferrodoxin [Phascolarctobacterium sp.]
MSVIFYFSGTGNSLDAARQAAAVLPQCRLEQMAAYLAHPYEVRDDIVGVVCPVYCFGLPPLVQNFLRALRAKPQYCFGLVTMGGNSGRALKNLQELLAQKNIELAYANSVAMPDNFFMARRAQYNEMLIAADKALTDIVTDIHKRRRDTAKCRENYVGKYLTTPVGWWFMRSVLHVGQPRLRPNRCVGCGLCARLCPVGNIKMEKQRPVFADKCAYCFACRHWCPKHAIQMGGLKAKADISYTNPNIKAEDLLRQEEK